ncbi:MAG: hypothetical protein GYB37_14240 [Algicola sp.]|nr:hypothetical protein [Algicola sp.]
MKKILGYAALFLLISTGARAQEFDLGDIMDEAQDFFGEAQEKAANEADIEATFEKIFEQLNYEEDGVSYKNIFLGSMKVFLGDFLEESFTGKCLTIMGEYAYLLAYCDMMAEQQTDPCKKKDWLGIETMVLFLGTAINYCPETFYTEEIGHNENETYLIQIATYFFGREDYAENYSLLSKHYASLQDKYFKNDYDYYDKIQEMEVDISNTIIGLDRHKKEHEDTHLKLFMKFEFANQQLKLNPALSQEIVPVRYLKSGGQSRVIGQEYDPVNYIEFVGKMFTPEYQLKKTLEIAAESSAIKCTH